ncbi:MAG: protein kinase [Labilithrix sp.]|nr:protein kinase [Labilithrix sp.]
MADTPNKNTDPHARTESAPLLSVPQGARATSVEEGPAVFAGRYEVLGLLGSGGMGTVYRARDRELEEMVALKVLRKELASSPGALERFRREVKLARRVTHKNVARTFDIGEHEGDRFLTMELIEGEMLGSHLARKGRLPLAEVVAVALDVCAGLSAAHAAGVLHRDLKPENVIIARDGRAVITDFGIARAASEAELGKTVGGIVGTPAYMAPEQVEGSRDLDARTDLYALGVMLFELLSGAAAWTGESAISIAAARILRPPPDVRTHLPSAPPTVAEVILKLMARQPADRFASAEEAAAAIGALTSHAIATSTQSLSIAAPNSLQLGRKALAVLPVVNLSASDDLYLAQTVTEDLVDLLSVVPELRVRPRGETARFDGSTRDVREIGRSLGVDVVVDGSMRRVGDVVRISVRLVTVEDGFQLWARRFDRAPAQVLTVADEAADAIARALTAQAAEHARPSVEDPVAQELYLRGRFLLRRGWFEISRDGVAMLREAHARVPHDTRIAGMYALAMARVVAADPSPDVVSQEARQLAARTLEIDPQQPEALVALGMTHVNEADYGPAAKLLHRALQIAPSSVEALDVVGRLLCESNRVERGFTILRRALAVDPGIVQSKHELARATALGGDYRTALELLGDPPENIREFVPYAVLLGRFALWDPNNGIADVLGRELQRRQQPTFAQVSTGTLYRVARTRKMTPEDKVIFEKSLPVDMKFTSKRLAFNAQVRTEVKLAVGDVDGALADLRLADQSGLIDARWLEHLPLLEGLRDRPEIGVAVANTKARAKQFIDVFDPAPR